MLIERWEYEIVEFKEAKGGYDTDKIGRYFLQSAMRQICVNSNMVGSFLELENRNKVKQVVGTSFKNGDKSLLERFKYEISRDTANGMTFYDIIENISDCEWQRIPSAYVQNSCGSDWHSNRLENELL